MEAQYAETKAENIVRKLMDAWNRHNANEIVALYSNEFHGQGPLRPPQGPADKQAERTIVDSVLSAFPDIHFKVSNTVAKDDIAWFAWESSATHKGTFQTPAGPIPATNKPVKLPGASFERVRNGLIVEERVYFDLADLTRQLGIKPS